MAKHPQRLRLTKRDLDVLRDAAAFGLITPELITPYRFPGRSTEAAKSTIRRLQGRPPDYLYLKPEPLDCSRVYCQLTGRGARLIGAPRNVTRPLGRQAVMTRYALAWLVCCEKPHKRSLLDVKLRAELFGKAGRLPKIGFYLDQTLGDQLSLGFAIVDHGAHAQRVARKAVRTAARFVASPVTRDFLLTGKFTLCVLTQNNNKRDEIVSGVRQRLERQLATAWWRLGVARSRAPRLRTEVLVVPSLERLLPGIEP